MIGGAFILVTWVGECGVRLTRGVGSAMARSEASVGARQQVGPPVRETQAHARF